jgi:hypothetical protein
MRIALFTFLMLVVLFVTDMSAATFTVAHTLTHPSLIGWGVRACIVIGVALGTGNLSLADWAKRLDPDGKVPTIVELLSQSNEVLLDMQWREGNLPTGHRTTVRTGLPAVAWRLLNQGVTPSKSTTAQIDEQCGMLEAWSEVDKDLAVAERQRAVVPTVGSARVHRSDEPGDRARPVLRQRRRSTRSSSPAVSRATRTRRRATVERHQGRRRGRRQRVDLARVWGDEDDQRHLPEGQQGRAGA